MIDPYDYPSDAKAQDLPINTQVQKIVNDAFTKGLYKSIGYVPPMVDREIDTLAKIHCWEFYDSFEMDCE